MGHHGPQVGMLPFGGYEGPLRKEVQSKTQAEMVNIL